MLLDSFNSLFFFVELSHLDFYRQILDTLYSRQDILIWLRK